jgi:hypothetical protein
VIHATKNPANLTAGFFYCGVSANCTFFSGSISSMKTAIMGNTHPMPNQMANERPSLLARNAAISGMRKNTEPKNPNMGMAFLFYSSKV